MADTATAEKAAPQSHGAHPTPKLYVQIAAVLFALTMMEFSTYFLDFGGLHIPLLIILMLIKFALVAGYFMHLKYDTRLYTRFMMTGLIGASILYTITLVAILEMPHGAGM